jgi:hypothetical protein
MLPAFSKNRPRIIFIVTARIAGFGTQSCQPSCSRDVEHNPDTYSLTVTSGAVAQLVRPTGEKKRSRGKHRSDILIGTPQKQILKDRNGKKIEEETMFL